MPTATLFLAIGFGEVGSGCDLSIAIFCCRGTGLGISSFAHFGYRGMPIL